MDGGQRRPWGGQIPSAVLFPAFGAACMCSALRFSASFPINQPSCYLWSFPSYLLRQTSVPQIARQIRLGALLCPGRQQRQLQEPRSACPGWG